MSPYRTGVAGGGGPWLWRGLIFVLYVIVGAIIFFGAGLIDDNHRAVKQLQRQSRRLHRTNRQIVQTNCLFGRAITATPPVKTPTETRRAFREALVLEAALLKNLQAEDCSHVAHGQVTSSEISHGLHRIHHEQTRQGFVSHSGGGGPGGNPGGQPPGGGGGAPSPGSTTPPPPPPSTTTQPTLTVPPASLCTNTPLPPACVTTPSLTVPNP